VSVKHRNRDINESRDDLTVRGVSLSAGLSDSALHKFLTSDSHSMMLSNLEKVADAMGVPLYELLVDQPPPAPAEVVNIWDRIPDRHRNQALTILRTFADGSEA
jgi:hypothetical protein